MPSRRPNHRLRQLLDEANWTGDALAREINTAGAETGLSLRYSRSSIAHWLSGMQPRRPAPQLIAEVFTRRLARPITTTEAGLEASAPAELPPGPVGDAVTRLATLAADSSDPVFLGSCVYNLAALDVPDWSRLAVSTPQSGEPGATAVRIGPTEVEAATLMCGLFSLADVTQGGRAARTSPTAYLRSTIAPWLRADSSARTRRQLLVTAAKLCYLHGFMCFDDRLHGLAQRYYLISAELASEGGDPSGYAIALRALSLQATTLGHRREAIQLAENALRSTQTHPVPARTAAFLNGQAAVAHAGGGEGETAMKYLRKADNEISRAERGDVPVGAFHAGSLAHQHAAVAASLGDRSVAVHALSVSLQHRPTFERRSRAIVLARMAELQAAGGNLEAACETWLLFLDAYREIRSGRADYAFSTMHAVTLPHQNNPSVRQLRHAAAQVVRDKAEV